MAGITYFGQSGSTGRSNGPHGHIYVRDLQTGSYRDPATLRSIQAGFRIGQNRIPALIKDEKGGYSINPQSGITVTSRFGPRGGREHQGEDWALPEGTPVYYEGAGTYKPLANQGGYGNLATFTTPDNKYEIGVGHMKSLGKEATVGGVTLPAAPGAQNAPSDLQRENDILKAYMYGAGIGLPQQEVKKNKTSFRDQLIGQMIEQALNPASFLPNYVAENPFLQGQSSATSDFLGGLFG
jgi:murein DD-endopeptidase MepM/ murein hydrolase activator NlpD